MYMTLLNEPRPTNADEIAEALEMTGHLAGEVNATVQDSRTSEAEDSLFYGWTAELFTEEDGEPVFTTLAFPTKDDIVKALVEAGLTIIHDEDGNECHA